MPRPPREDDEEDRPPRPRRRPAENEDLDEAVEPAERARRPRPRRDEEFEEDDRPRRRRSDEEEDEDDWRPRGRHRPNYKQDEFDNEFDRPRRRRDAIESLIPYHNPKALAAYYCGVFSLIPGLGLLLGPLALILGMIGIRFSRENDTAGGVGHAITGVILGGLTSLANWGFALFFGFLFITRK
jgi:hypothetical protein